MLNDHLYLTVDELAHVSRLSRRTIYNKLSAGGVGFPRSINRGRSSAVVNGLDTSLGVQPLSDYYA